LQGFGDGVPENLKKGENAMSIELLPIIAIAATTGIACGAACGGCGNPLTNVFLAAYVFTHTNRLKKSALSFASFFAGKIIAVVLLCIAAAWLGSRIVDDTGRLFGLNIHFLVQFLMLVFALFLIGRWFYRAKNPQHECCGEHQKKRSLPLFVCGMISGAAPCAPLIMAVGYASVLSVANAAIIGLVFSVASSLLPLAILVVLTGLLSGAMFREIPSKIRYFQLAAYVFFAVMSGSAILQI
jgi:lysylphosphatidylglycerol synthetase-like protein (DUF2156 family)